MLFFELPMLHKFKNVGLLLYIKKAAKSRFFISLSYLPVYNQRLNELLSGSFIQDKIYPVVQVAA